MIDPRAENLAIEAKQAAISMGFYAAFETHITGEYGNGRLSFDVSATHKSKTSDPPTDGQLIEWREDDERAKQLLAMLSVSMPIVTHFEMEKALFPSLFEED